MKKGSASINDAGRPTQVGEHGKMHPKGAVTGGGPSKASINDAGRPTQVGEFGKMHPKGR